MQTKHVRRPVSGFLILILLVGLASPAILAYGPGSRTYFFTRVKFGNVSFDVGTFADVVDQGQTMLLISTNARYHDTARVTVGPVSSGSADALIARMWPPLAAGKQLKHPIVDDDGLMLNGGGRIHRHFADFSDGSYAFILIAEVNGKLTPFVQTASNAIETTISGLIMSQIILTIRGEADIGTGATGQAPDTMSIGSPSALGDDPYDTVKWNGPDELGFGVYDIHPINVKRELKEIAVQAPDFIGSVTPKLLTFDQAIANLRAVADAPMTKEQYAQFKAMGTKDPSTLQGTAFTGILSGEPLSVLLELFAAYEIHPEDPNNWLNLAAMCSHVRLANESTAILKEMGRRGKKPDPPIISADAAIEYLTGYNQLLFGQTLTAKGHLHKATDLDPFLKEAAIALALAYKLTGDEEAAEAAYIQGVWRRRPTQTLICGGVGTSDGPDIRPPIPDMLDVSHGSPGVLPNFDHPNNWSEALGLKDRYEKTLNQMLAEERDLVTATDQIHGRIRTHRRTSTENWHEDLDTLIATLRTEEPQVIKALAIKDKARTEMHDAIERIGKRTGPKLLPIMMQPGDHHNELAAIATDNVASLRPFAQAYDTALRRLFRLEHRFKTGLATQMGDDDWHQLESSRVKTDALAAYADLAGTMIISYALVANIVPPPAPAPILLGMNPDDIAECPDGVRNLGFKVQLEDPLAKIKIGMKVQCNKMSLEVAAYPFSTKGPLDLGLGFFGQVDLTGKGDITIFAGEAAKAGVGVGVSGKEGFYVQGNVRTGNVKDFGVKLSVDASGKTPWGTGSIKLDEMKFSFMPSVPQASRGLNLKQF